MKTHWTSKLAKLKPCKNAFDWCKKRPSLEVAWKKCQRPDWMVWLIGKMLKGEKETRILASCLLACLDKEIEAGGYRTEADKKIALEIMDLIGKTAQKRLTKNSIKEFSKVLDKNFRSYQKLYYCSESLTDRVFSIVDIVRYRTNRTGLIAGYVVNHLVSSSACANIIRGWEWYPKPPKLIIKGK